MSRIPASPRNLKINIIVSPEDYEHLNQFKWYISNNYIITKIKDSNGKYKSWRLHRYIMIEILKNDITSKNPIDHINNNPLDNRRENLRIVTHSENARNKKKKENCTSKYIGVSKCIPRTEKENIKWGACIRHNSKKIAAYYNDELHAAYQYNLWIDEFKIKNANKNDIEIPENFIKWKPTKEKVDNIPIGIEKYKDNKFRVKIRIDNKEKHIGIFNTQEDALEARKKAEKEREEYFKNKLLSIPKEFNKDNQCIFKVKDEEIIIDEEIFYEIMKYKWYNNNNGYLKSEIDGKIVGLSNFIMNYYEDNYIDHINNNPLDNRKCNLRIVTARQNMMNKSSAKNSSSKYIGVHWNKTCKKWISNIYYNGKSIHLGTFSDEIEAAKVRDIATKKYFGEHGKLNFPVSS